MSVDLLITRVGVPQIALSVPTMTTVAQLKQSLCKLAHLPAAHRPPHPDQQHLLFSGQLLGDDAVIGDVLREQQVCDASLLFAPRPDAR